MTAEFIRNAYEPLCLVGTVKFDSTLPHLDVCEEMFAFFNRGSGRELSFSGPSMSVDDFVRIVSDDNVVSYYRCASFGFTPTASPLEEIIRSFGNS